MKLLNLLLNLFLLILLYLILVLGKIIFFQTILLFELLILSITSNNLNSLRSSQHILILVCRFIRFFFLMRNLFFCLEFFLNLFFHLQISSAFLFHKLSFFFDRFSWDFFELSLIKYFINK